MISHTEARTALLRSGYLLESRVEEAFRRRGYYVEANSVFPDGKTGTSREVDVYAMRADKAGPGDFDFLFTLFIVECVNNPEPLILITKRPQVGFLHHHEIKLSGLPVKFPDSKRRGAWISFVDFLDLEGKHHYCQGRIATQYCSFQQKRQAPQDWMAWHDEAHFDAFKKACAAVEHKIADHFGSWVVGAAEPVNVQLYYPVVVVQGELLEALPSRNQVTLRSRPRLSLRRSEFVNGEERTYQVDVVREQHLARYLALVESESARMTRLLRRRHKQVRRSIDSIARSARRLKSPKAIRKALQF